MRYQRGNQRRTRGSGPHPSIRKILRRARVHVNLLIYRFCDPADGGPSYSSSLSSADGSSPQEWLESFLAEPEAPRRRRRGYSWERIAADVRDHTVELSVFWHVIRSQRTPYPSRLPASGFAPSANPSTSSWLSCSSRNQRGESPAESASPNCGNEITVRPWNKRVPTCRSTPGFLSHPPAFPFHTASERVLLPLPLSRFLPSVFWSFRAKFDEIINYSRFDEYSAREEERFTRSDTS